MNNKHSKVRIYVAANGYMAFRDNAYNDPLSISDSKTYVFETFRGLTDWLKANLEQPTNE